MANLGLSYPNRAIDAAVTGGSWLAALPASNVANRELAKVARSTNATTGSTKLQLDLGAARTLRAFAIVNHNLSAAATWLLKLGTSSGASDVHSGSAVNAWQLAAFDATAAALGVDDAAYQRNDYASIIVLPQSYSARHLTIEINDTANVDGYVQIGMVFAGGLFVPEVNPDYGSLEHGHMDLSSGGQSESGAPNSTARRRLRTASFVLSALTDAETHLMHEQQRVSGTVDDVLYVPDIADAALQQRYGFVGRLGRMDRFKYAQYGRQAKGFELVERGV